jgi:hypothetical protein
MQDVQDEATASLADVATPQASRYLTQLCKHFEHKLAVEHDVGAGRISFTSGTARLRAEPDVLHLSVEAADPAARAQLEDVVARHLKRFAFREELLIAWQPQRG